MNNLKSAIIYLKRNVFHSIILLLVIFLLGTLSLGAISAYRMITSTEENLWANLPAVTIIEEDQLMNELYWISYGIWPAPPITRGLIEEIAELPYVNYADISLNFSLYSRYLDRFWDLVDELDFMGLTSMGVQHVERFEVKGVSQSDFAALNSNIIQISSGSTFTTEQLVNGIPVALISQEVADINDLEVGSLITLENLTISTGANISFENWFDDDNIIDNQVIEFEVIGIYDLQGSLNEFGDFYFEDMVISGGNAAIQALNMINIIYVPYEILQQMINYRVESMTNLWGEEGVNRTDFFSVDNFIILNDPRDFPAFHEAVSDILPEFLTASDVTASFQNVFVSMNSISEVAIFILIFLIVASLLLLMFLIMLLLRNRKHEIGIYLALGKRKRSIIFQFKTEILLVTVIAITLSLFINQAISVRLSRHFVTQEMASVQVQKPTQGIMIENQIFMRNEHLLDWFVPEVREVEELIEIFDISLQVSDILFFYSGAIVIAMSSVTLSTLYVMRLKPREILTVAEY